MIKTAIIGFGRMGEFYFRELSSSMVWEVKYICDTDEDSRMIAQNVAPHTEIISDENVIFDDPSVQVVILSALADSRKGQIERAVQAGKHIICEKPLADKIGLEWEVVKNVENSDVIATVNLSLRNAWYNKVIKEFIKSGELGELAIVRICHMTPGLAPGEGHTPEGPCFHDCGMHYVDLARWFAESEYKSWNAQALDFWDWGEPWWLQCHGTFENGVVFDITQGHIYGQLSKDQVHFSYNDIIGTKGIARMTHDFHTAKVELHGVTKTEVLEMPFGDKNIDVLCANFAKSIAAGKLDSSLPTLRDAAMASEYAWRFLEDAKKNDLPVRGDRKTLEEIRARRCTLENGYGLLRRK